MPTPTETAIHEREKQTRQTNKARAAARKAAEKRAAKASDKADAGA